VVTVTLPKSAQQERTRRIQVQRGAASSQGNGQMIQGSATNANDQQQQQGGNGKNARTGGSIGDRQQG
jgi:hypothetical protein